MPLLIRFTSRSTLAASAVLLAVLAFCAAVPARAQASPFQVSLMQDDNQLVYGTDDQRERALRLMKQLGVDSIRVSVLWSFVAPKQRLSGTAGANPASYSVTRWDRFDELVESAQRRGIEVHFNLTGPGPRWTQQRAKDAALQRGYKPDAKAYGQFVRAFAVRYSGGYKDENGGILPRVRSWSLWNEPNFASWLSPQSEPSKLLGGRFVPTAPIMYRELLIGGASALLRSGHGDDLISIGETAPLGSPKLQTAKGLRPARFIRELFCLDDALRPFRGAAAKARRCDRLAKLKLLETMPRVVWGHHPYTKRLAPTTPSGERDSITMANINALPKLLDRVAAKRPGAFPGNAGVILTEFGYETQPPDPWGGVSFAKQAEYINEGDYIAFRSPRVIGTTQFQLDDVPPDEKHAIGSRQYWRTYQSGLFDLNGHVKPAANAYAFPFAMSKVGSETEFWGQLRFAPNGTTQSVQLQIKGGGGEFANVGPPLPVTNEAGFFTVRAPVPAGTIWRAVWTAPDGGDARYSRATTAP